MWTIFFGFQKSVILDEMSIKWVDLKNDLSNTIEIEDLLHYRNISALIFAVKLSNKNVTNQSKERYFFRIKSLNNVCLNLTTKTSKYRLDVSQLSHQCFTGFFLSLLSKKSKHFFFRNFF